MVQTVRAIVSRQSIFQFTFFVSGNRRVFKDYSLARVLTSLLIRIVPHHSVDILGYVVMPNHVHILIRAEGSEHARAFASDFVAVTSPIGRASGCQVWRTTYETVLITSEADFFRKLHDIHSNPIRRKLCKAATDYPHSSAAAWLRGIDDGVTRTGVNVKELFDIVKLAKKTPEEG